MTNDLYNFGKYSILTNDTHYFKNEPKWWVKFRVPNGLDELERQKMLSQFTDNDLAISNIELCFWEVSRLFKSTNIPAIPDKPVEKGGDPIIVEGAEFETVYNVICMLPSPMSWEIWEAIGTSLQGQGWGFLPLTKEPTEKAEETESDSNDGKEVTQKKTG